MELPGFDELPLPDLPLFSTLSTPEFEFEHTAEWTYEENKQFEDALAEFDPTSPFFFENVASKVPWKSIGQIKKHYEALVEDIEMIESGLVPMPDYREAAEEPQGGMEIKNGKGSSSCAKKPNDNHSRRRGLPWTEEEHKLAFGGFPSS
ncbi:protein RADIALIS-like 1 [Cornus florida]|uniref:protein RADIALIS-like 1 n=1 Tax=Cornus florida TaxID=4283 RepID=UPI00289D20A3|nr:protein RADIALIS-like 1 [Cornus florida]